MRTRPRDPARRTIVVEAFQWLAQEIRQAQGEAMVLHVTRVDGLSDQQLIALFQAARTEEYDELDGEAAALEQTIREHGQAEQQRELIDILEKLRRRFAEVARVDYFGCPAGVRVGARLAVIERLLAPPVDAGVVIMPARLADYRAARWVTRPRPHVDRLACAWLIRRFINPDAAIRYSSEPEPDEIAFDMAGARFGHQGSRCTFETMIEVFELDAPGLSSMAEIVHEIDLRDRRFTRPEIAGIEVVLDGWQLADLTDAERERYGIALFDGLAAALGAQRRQDRMTVGAAP